ncbi:tyrosine-type recombinase/integrase [Bergeyella zoohelcum]|uniref:tyrosine-type recombinase/integrase n=1 Tax=Bergeyella zoohelcum TaxID=1015 RepID=UPI002A90A370|nr:tyrosine-type recombinase/integrase [Bergeyella zoohelcum]MDY6026397.1 phage integrase SAM-like domain-containing protein [Bergeyella zoohelcum]
MKNKPYKDNSFHSGRTALVNLKEFLSDSPLYINDFTTEFLKEFGIFMNEKGLSMNSVTNNVKSLITLVDRLIIERRITVGKDFKVPTINMPKEITTAVFTTEAEIDLLANMDLSLTEKLCRVRDVYIIQAYTGLRFSDMIKVIQSPQSYYKEQDGNAYFYLKSTKTDQDLLIPLKKIVVDILVRRNFKFGKPFTLHHYNKRLKELFKSVGINETMVKYITIGGERKEIHLEKWKMISSHTARRSFATNAYLKGVPTSFIRKITGHTTEESLLRYIRANNHEIALKSKEYDFFK